MFTNHFVFRCTYSKQKLERNNLISYSNFVQLSTKNGVWRSRPKYVDKKYIGKMTYVGLVPLKHLLQSPKLFVAQVSIHHCIHSLKPMLHKPQPALVN